MWHCNVSRSDFAGLVFADIRGKHVYVQSVFSYHVDPLGNSVEGRVVAWALDGHLIPRLDALVAISVVDPGIHNVANFPSARNYL